MHYNNFEDHITSLLKENKKLRIEVENLKLRLAVLTDLCKKVPGDKK